MVQRPIERVRPPRRRFVSRILGASLLAVTLSVPHAGALTPWRTFGNGSAVGRGTFGGPSLSVGSTTKRNPEFVRFAVSGPPIRADISFDIFCWRESDFEFRSASGSFRARLPFVRVVSRAGRVSRFDFCELDVSAFYFDPGRLKVTLQSRYP